MHHRAIAPIPTPQDLLAEIRPQAHTVRHFRSGRINQYGRVEGVKEFPAGTVPFERQDHHYDTLGRVVYLEIFVRDFSRPTIRCYRYQDDTSAVTEAVWIVRYGRIENVHRYEYDEVLGLLLWRAEYDHEGHLYYSIGSSYDASNHLVEERWLDPHDRFMKRYAYAYEANSELSAELHYDQHDELQGFNRFQYDRRGNLTERAWHDPAGHVRSRFCYTHDSRDHLIRLCLLGGDGQLQIRQEFESDPIGNPIREQWFDPSGELIKDLNFQID